MLQQLNHSKKASGKVSSHPLKDQQQSLEIISVVTL